MILKPNKTMQLKNAKHNETKQKLPLHNETKLKTTQ